MLTRLPTHSLFAFSRFSFLANLPDRFLLFTFLTIISIASRLCMIGTLPVAVTHDEVFYANQAKSLSFSGTDQTQIWKPTDFTSSHSLFAEWPGVIASPGFMLFSDNPLFASRFISAVLGGLLPLLLAGISWQLFAKKKMSLIVFVLAMINPWMFQVSRHGFDVVFTLFFYLSGFWALLSTKNAIKLTAIPFFFIGFFQYQAGKVLLLPLVLIICTYVFAQTRKLHKPITKSTLISLLIVLIATLGLVGWFSTTLSSQAASSRINDIVLFDTQSLTKQVNAARASSINTIASPIVFNKFTILIKMLSLQFVKSIDLQQYFLIGEPIRNPTTVWTHGLFYLFDAVLIIIGMALLAVDKRWRYQSWLFFSIALISFIPQVINTKDTWVFLRLGLLYPILIMYASVGFYFIWKHFKPGILFKSGIIGIYLVSASYFGYQLFFVSPITATTDNYFSERVLASYLNRLPLESEALVLADQSRFIFEEILFYNNLITQNNATAIGTAMATGNYTVEQIKVDTNCFNSAELSQKVIIKDSSVANCENTVLADTKADDFILNQAVLRSPYSGTEVFTILNDSLCNENMASVIPSLNLRLLDVEALSNEEFCQTYIVKKI